MDEVANPRVNPARPATIKDVARLAGVSAGLVSMALSDHPAVATATKIAIRQAAERLDYVPNSVGRALRARRLGAIAVVIPHSSHHVFSHPYFVEVLEGVTEVASAHDLTVVLSTSREDQDEEAAYVKLLRSRRADGVIVAAAAIADQNVARLAASGYPVVVLGRDPQDPAVVSVVTDDRQGSVYATTHLLATHYARRLAHIAGPLGHRSAVDKLAGYRAALEAHGSQYDERLVAESDYTEQGGAAACDRLLATGIPFDGLVAANDQMAFGALQSLRRHGREVPRDLAVVGFDDIPLARLMQPPLTTVHQPMTEIGRRATERLIALLEGQSPEPRQIEIPTTLVIRRSCGCHEEVA